MIISISDFNFIGSRVCQSRSSKRNYHDSSPPTHFIVIVSFIICELFPRFTGVIADVFCQAIAQNDQWVLWNTKQTKLLLYMRTYVNWPPPTQIFKLILETFWIAQIDGRDPLITNIIFWKKNWGQIRSPEVNEHLKNLKNIDFFNI